MLIVVNLLQDKFSLLLHTVRYLFQRYTSFISILKQLLQNNKTQELSEDNEARLMGACLSGLQSKLTCTWDHEI